MLPSLLTSRLKSILWNDYNTVIESFAKNRKGSFRINTLKTDGEDVFKEFKEKGIIVETFEGMNGVYIFDRLHEYAIKWSHAFYDGKIYLQSIASMLPVLVLDPKAGDTIVDVCAAPGSKTTQLAMLMQNQWHIFAIEQNQIRYDKLLHNCVLQWADIIEWVKMDARHWLSSTSGSVVIKNDVSDIIFDAILLDAPCSAEWRISVDNEKTYGFWTLTNIQKKAELQSELLHQAFDRLVVGGVLVYSTCTLAPEENEWVVSDFLKTHKNAILEPIDIGLNHKPWWKQWLIQFGKNTTYDPILSQSVRILPSEDTEGFYIAKIRKV